MSGARVRLPPELDGLLASEWAQIIREAGYSAEDAEIVRQYIVGKQPQIDVAIGLCMERSTISRRLPEIYARAAKVARKMRYIS